MNTMQVHSPLPPPPPPPPPMPSPSQRPLVHQPVRVAPTTMAPRAASTLIRPTKAGLIQYQGSEEWDDDDDEENVTVHFVPQGPPLPDVMNSRLFKDELLERQSRLAGVNSNSTIEEKIRQRKNEADERLLSQSNDSLVPEKLMSNLQRDKKPFAYTPDVNDPNNRGKLDLSQIKSPIMRRRLLANMESSDSNDESPEEGEPNHNNSEPYSDNNLAYNQAQSDNRAFMQSPHLTSNGYSNQPQAAYSPAPTKQQPLVQQKTVRKQETVVRYNEPPVFYNTNYNNTHNLQPVRPVEAINRNTYTTKTNCIDELDDEVAKSIDSLSLLVDSLQNQQPKSVLEFRTPEVRSQAKQQQPSYQRMSTFSPGVAFNSSPETMNTRLNSNSSMSNGSTSSSPAYQSYSDRSIGDYLLAPDSNYFSMGSSSSPYSVSPYYGSPLGIENYGPTRDYTQVKQTSAKTFSPNYNSTNKSHYYYRGNMNHKSNPEEQQFRQY